MTQTTAMCLRLASDAKGIESIVREHYRKFYGSVSIDVAVDMDRLRVTVSILGYKSVCRIQKYFLDKRPLYCIIVLVMEE